VQAEAPAPAPHHAPAAASAADWPAESVVVRAPMMGTFYRSPAPGAPPFVSIGQAVEAGTTVCIIEVMKLMNSIPAGVSGVVTHVLAEDTQSVEADAALVVVDPRRTSA
jgi:acetyl-CoA carboxylase biotin carboxyl carrier protein